MQLLIHMLNSLITSLGLKELWLSLLNWLLLKIQPEQTSVAEMEKSSEDVPDSLNDFMETLLQDILSQAQLNEQYFRFLA